MTDAERALLLQVINLPRRKLVGEMAKLFETAALECRTFTIEEMRDFEQLRSQLLALDADTVRDGRQLMNAMP